MRKDLSFIFFALFSWNVSAAIVEDCCDDRTLLSRTDSPKANKERFEPGRLSINVMWLSNSYIPDLFPDSQRDNIVSSIADWGRQHPDSETPINFWYNGQKVGKSNCGEKLHRDVVEQGRSYLKEALPQGISERVNFIDIQTMAFLTDEDSKDFLDDDLSIYFHSDISRFLIGKELLGNGQCDTFIYSDLNVTAQPKEELFIPQTVDFLNRLGFVNLRHRYEENPAGGMRGFENKFLMMRRDQDLFNAISRVLVSPLSFRIKELMSEQIEGFSEFEQIVYDSILSLTLFVAHEKGEIFICDFEGSFKPSRILKYAGQSLAWNHENLKVKKSNISQGYLSVGDFSVLTKGLYWTDEDRALIRRDMTNIGLGETAVSKRRLAERRRKNAQNKLNFNPQGLNWPANLPVPAHRMQAPMSHFG